MALIARRFRTRAWNSGVEILDLVYKTHQYYSNVEDTRDTCVDIRPIGVPFLIIEDLEYPWPIACIPVKVLQRYKSVAKPNDGVYVRTL